MGIFGALKDLALLPVDAALDLTGISLIIGDEPKIRTGERLDSFGKNLDETLD